MPKKKKGGRPRYRKAADEALAFSSQNPNMAEEPQSQPQEDPPSHPPVEGGESGDPEYEEPQEIAASPAPLPDVRVPDLPLPNPPPSSRKPPGKRKKPRTEKQLAAAQQKLSLLEENLRPIPFSPAKKPLDFSKHEELFRSLGLWDFAHLELDREIRSDLLVFLIANYDSPNRRSYVNDVRISVSRSDLARALLLPVKKEKANSFETNESHLELFKREESTAVIEDFMSSYMLFEGDMCILPPEVVKASHLVKEGMPHKVDWAGLMWVLVEKELLEAPRSGDCHYASHLQCLMKSQRPGLFGKEAEPVPVPEPESSMEVSMEEEEDDVADGGETRMRSLEDFQDMGMEKPGPMLRLGLGGNEDIMDGLEDCKEGEEEQWVAEGKNEGFEHCLQRCNSNDVRGMEFENLCKGEQEGREEERYVDDISAKFSSLERLTSTDLLQAMDSVHVSYSPQMNSLDPSTGDFLSTRADDHKNMTLDPGPGGSLFFRNNGKRHIGDTDDEEDDIHQFPQNNQQKRMRSGGVWEQTSSDFDTYMEQVQCSMGKAKMLYAEKEQACISAHLQLQYLNGILQEKDQIIQSLEKTRVEELQKWQQAVCRYEHELNVMAHLMLGYKKALRETRRQFTEYRENCSQCDEPLYRDVGGPGGLVLSSRELERQCLEKEEEMRRTAAEMIDDFQTGWASKFDEYAGRVFMLHRRLVELAGDIELLKEKHVESKDSDD